MEGEGVSSNTEDLEDLFENAPCGYVSAQAEGRITKVNRTFITWTGFAHDDLIGRRFQDILNIAGKIYYETHFAPLLRMQGFFHEVALDLVRADGVVMPVLVNAVERRDSTGGLRFIRMTIFNASDRRRYEAELLEAARPRSGRTRSCVSSIRRSRRESTKLSTSDCGPRTRFASRKKWRQSVSSQEAFRTTSIICSRS